MGEIEEEIRKMPLKCHFLLERENPESRVVNRSMQPLPLAPHRTGVECGATFLLMITGVYSEKKAGVLGKQAQCGLLMVKKAANFPINSQSLQQAQEMQFGPNIMCTLAISFGLALCCLTISSGTGSHF